MRHPCDSPASAQPDPAMWNIGITARFTDSGESSHEDAICSMPQKKLSFVSITPLGKPVVPDV